MGAERDRAGELSHKLNSKSSTRRTEQMSTRRTESRAQVSHESHTSLTQVSHESHTSLTHVSHQSHTRLTPVSHESHTSLTLATVVTFRSGGESATLETLETLETPARGVAGCRLKHIKAADVYAGEGVAARPEVLSTRVSTQVFRPPVHTTVHVCTL